MLLNQASEKLAESKQADEPPGAQRFSGAAGMPKAGQFVYGYKNVSKESCLFHSPSHCYKYTLAGFRNFS